MRSLLRGLRVNCLIAALLPCTLGVASLLLLAIDQRAAQRQLAGQGLADLVASLATAPDESPPGWAGPWRRVTLDADGRVHLLSGQPASEDPPPGLVAAGAQASWWANGQQLEAAALVHRDGHPDHLLWISAAAPPASWRPWLLGGVVTLSGVAMAAYLARRVWRPVQELEALAQAALTGAPLSQPRYSSSETSAVASAVRDLAARYSDEHRPDAQQPS